MRDALIRPAKQIGIALAVLILLYIVGLTISTVFIKPVSNQEERRTEEQIEDDQIAREIPDDGSYIIEEGSFHTTKFSIKLPFETPSVTVSDSQYELAGANVSSREFGIARSDADTAQIRLADIELDNEAAERQVIEAAGKFLGVVGIDHEDPEITELEVGKRKFVKLTYTAACEGDQCEESDRYYDLFITAINDNRLLFIQPGRYQTEILSTVSTR